MTISGSFPSSVVTAETTTILRTKSPSNDSIGSKRGTEHSIKSTDETVIRRGDGKTGLQNNISKRTIMDAATGSFRRFRTNEKAGVVACHHGTAGVKEDDGKVDCRCKWFGFWRRKKMMWV
jgi:hypothetical protein